MNKSTLFLLLFIITFLQGQSDSLLKNIFLDAESLDVPNYSKVIEKKDSPIKIKVDDFYGLKPDENGHYHLTLSESNQTIIKLEGTIDRKEGYHRVTWKTDKTYKWSNGMVTDEFKVVNPASYSKNGKVYTMFGPLPEMKGSSVLITATYGLFTDSIIIHLY